jgi:hypothetical protein
MRPGRVVWAKVEGHDWWPARVVRRRAVPREVGPPPGGQVSSWVEGMPAVCDWWDTWVQGWVYTIWRTFMLGVQSCFLPGPADMLR